MYIFQVLRIDYHLVYILYIILNNNSSSMHQYINYDFFQTIVPEKIDDYWIIAGFFCWIAWIRIARLPGLAFCYAVVAWVGHCQDCVLMIY